MSVDGCDACFDDSDKCIFSGSLSQGTKVKHMTCIKKGWSLPKERYCCPESVETPSGRIQYQCSRQDGFCVTAGPDRDSGFTFSYTSMLLPMMFIMVLMLLLVFRSLRYRMLMRRHQEGLVAIEMRQQQQEGHILSAQVYQGGSTNMSFIPSAYVPAPQPYILGSPLRIHPAYDHNYPPSSAVSAEIPGSADNDRPNARNPPAYNPSIPHPTAPECNWYIPTAQPVVVGVPSGQVSVATPARAEQASASARQEAWG